MDDRSDSNAVDCLNLGSDMRITAILGGRMRLDGGAMFGVVPRPLWERVSPPDERNRVANACRCLLIQTDAEVILVDTGCGDRFDERSRDIFAVDQEVSLSTSLTAAGVTAADITHVLFTHLHFDHSAGALQQQGNDLVPMFPNAIHIVQQGEFDDARAGRSIMRSSYLPADLNCLADSVSWRWLQGAQQVVPGVRVEVTGGHTAHHQSVVAEAGDHTLLFAGDVMPTRAHLRPYWVMAYDMYPHDTFTGKQALAERACAEDWIVAWDHDPDVPWSRLRRDDRHGFTAIDLEPAS